MSAVGSAIIDTKLEGLVQISPRAFAYLQPDGGMGLSNAGLLAGARESMLVDTLWDLARTRRMLAAIERRVSAPITRVINTHGNGDHCWGNQLVKGATIIGHRRCAEEMLKYPPQILQELKRTVPNRPFLRALQKQLQPFDFTGIELTPPTCLFDERLALEVDGARVELIYVGPAHTSGDIIVLVPDEGVLFSGDIIFCDCTPLGWEGSYANWIAALEQIAALDIETIVPGHGPLCGKEGALQMRDYLRYVRDESRLHYEAGRSIADAAARIELGPYAAWREPERIVYNVARAYGEFQGHAADSPPDFFALADAAAQWAERRTVTNGCSRLS